MTDLTNIIKDYDKFHDKPFLEGILFKNCFLHYGNNYEKYLEYKKTKKSKEQ